MECGMEMIRYGEPYQIVNYADKNGNITKTLQRNIIYIGDMIVCGDKEGPLSPSYKKVGGMLFADNAVEFDLFLTKLMGFNYLKIPTFRKAIEDSMLYNSNESVYFKSNILKYSGELDDSIEDFRFIPTSGWKDYLQD